MFGFLSLSLSFSRSLSSDIFRHYANLTRGGGKPHFKTTATTRNRPKRSSAVGSQPDSDECNCEPVESATAPITDSTARWTRSFSSWSSYGSLVANQHCPLGPCPVQYARNRSHSSRPMWQPDRSQGNVHFHIYRLLIVNRLRLLMTRYPCAKTAG